MIKTSIERGFKAGFSLAIGVIISDIIFIALTIFSSQFVDYKAEYNQYVGIIGGLFLLGIGIYYLVNKVKVSYDSVYTLKIRKRGYILKGFLMCILTPSTLMFWIMVGGIISVKLHYDMAEKVVFFVIAMATQLTVDCIKTYYPVNSGTESKKNIQTLNKIAGAVIIIFAIRIFIKVLLKYYK